ncbi:L-aspartate 1-decarboxylase [Streptococcus equinus]|nr:aspartate 1-decarboxylase [Streptococcus equinus]SEK63372.1 L-aspartate 1-decarboxylase [Streptococcus equinus]
MHIQMLKSKIHRAVVTGAEVDYVGSITVDPELFETAGMVEYEKVQIADVETGSRLETYIIAGEPGKGEICLNGAAAKLVNVGDHVIIMSYADFTPDEAKTHKPRVVFVDEHNKLTRFTRYEKAGRLYDLEVEK